MVIEGIIGGATKALYYLFIAGIAGVAWKIAYDQTKKSKSNLARLLVSGFLICTILAFLATVNLGSHLENCDDDPIYGRCDRVQDYEPSQREKAENFSRVLIFLYLPVAYGIYKGRKG